MGVYTESTPFVTVRISNRDKRPFRRLKVTLLSRLVIRTVTKGAFARDVLKANFRPFVMVGVTTRDKRGSFSLGWYHYPGLKGNFAREINISLFLTHLSHSFCFEHLKNSLVKYLCHAKLYYVKTKNTYFSMHILFQELKQILLFFVYNLKGISPV
jgi:hypothetical protein